MNNCTTPVLLGSAAIAITCAAPKRDAPAALQLPKKLRPCSLMSLVQVPVEPSQFFMVGFKNHSRSCPFLLIHKRTRFLKEKRGGSGYLSFLRNVYTITAIAESITRGTSVEGNSGVGMTAGSWLTKRRLAWMLLSTVASWESDTGPDSRPDMPGHPIFFFSCKVNNSERRDTFVQ